MQETSHMERASLRDATHGGSLSNQHMTCDLPAASAPADRYIDSRPSCCGTGVSMGSLNPRTHSHLLRLHLHICASVISTFIFTHIHIRRLHLHIFTSVTFTFIFNQICICFVYVYTYSCLSDLQVHDTNEIVMRHGQI